MGSRTCMLSGNDYTERIECYSASGAFGEKSFTNNNSMVLYGLGSNFLIAYSFTIFFYWLYILVPIVNFRIGFNFFCLNYFCYIFALTIKILYN